MAKYNIMKSYRKETNLSEDRIDELQKQYYYSNQVCGEVLNQQLDEGPIMLIGKDTRKIETNFQEIRGQKGTFIRKILHALVNILWH